MGSGKLDNTTVQIKSVTYIGMVVNCVLSFFKIIVGLLGGSLALVADGIHSFSDLATDATVLIGVWLGSKKADYSHPYGHGRAETFAGGIIALILIMVGGLMIYYASISIARDEVAVFHFYVLAAAVASIVSKEWLYRITKKIAVKSHSPSLYANAWHHRSDALSSVAVLVGYVSIKFGLDHGDQIAANAVGLMVILVGVRIIGNCLRELTEGSVDKETIEQITQIIAEDSSIRQWHQLRTRTVGREIFLDLHILVDPELNVAAAHEISENLEKALDERISQPINIVIHIEPDIPTFRR